MKIEIVDSLAGGLVVRDEQGKVFLGMITALPEHPDKGIIHWYKFDTKGWLTTDANTVEELDEAFAALHPEITAGRLTPEGEVIPKKEQMQ